MLRTQQNIIDADGTVLFGRIDPKLDRGSHQTRKMVEQLEKPGIHFSLDDLRRPKRCARELRQWAIDNNIQVVNVAGNKGSKFPGLESRVQSIIEAAFREPLLQVKPTIPIKPITLKYVPAHAGIEHNERCDQIAEALAQGEKLTLRTSPQVDIEEMKPTFREIKLSNTALLWVGEGAREHLLEQIKLNQPQAKPTKSKNMEL